MKFVYILVVLLYATNIYGQVEIVSDEMLTQKIKHSDKEYKLICIFCNYCTGVEHRYSEVVKEARNNKNMEAFFICAQDGGEIAQNDSFEKMGMNVYLINQLRKRKLISFYNPIKAAAKYLKTYLGVDSEEMGASAFCILDKENKVIVQTNWKMEDDEYFRTMKVGLQSGTK